MNKNLTKIAALSVSLAMAIGVGVALGSKAVRGVKAADQTVTFTMAGFGGITANQYQNSAVSGTGSNSAGGTIAASSYAFNGSSGQVRGNKTAIAGATVSNDNNKNWHLFNVAAIPGAIKSIVVTAGTVDSSNYLKGSLYVALGTSSQGSVTSVTGATSASATKTGGSSVANTFSFANLNATEDYTYFKLMSNVAFTSGSVKAISVVVTYDASTPAPSHYISEMSATSSVNPLVVTENDLIDESIFTLTGTKDSVPGTELTLGDYVFLGSGVKNGNVFTPSSTTKYTLGDNYLCWKSELDTSSSDTTKQVAYFPVTVNEAVLTEFELVTSDSMLVSGSRYVISSIPEAGSASFIGAQSTNNFGSVAGTVASNKVSLADNLANFITLGTSNDNYTMHVSSGYLYAASSSSNHLKTEAELDENGNGEWSIAISSGVATIVAQGTSTHNYLRSNPNNGNPIFSCYEADKQNDVALWKEVGGGPELPSMHIGAFDADDPTTEYYAYYHENEGSHTLYLYDEDNNVVTGSATFTSSNNNIFAFYQAVGSHGYTFTTVAPGTVTLTASVEGYKSTTRTVTVDAGNVTNLSMSGSMTKTSYSTNDDWDPTGFSVTATYNSGYQGDVTSDTSWGFVPEKPAEGVTSVIVNAFFGGLAYSSEAQAVTVTVAHAGTAEDPFTVVEALAKAHEIGAVGNTGQGPWVTTGIISRVTSAPAATYWNATYYISDDGSQNNELQVYRGYYLDNEKFDADTALLMKAGMIVTVTGNLTGSYGCEYCQGNYLLSIESPSTGDIDVTFEPETSLEISDTGTFTATADTTNPTYAWESDNPSVLSVDASTGEYEALELGTAKVTVTVTDGDKTGSAFANIVVNGARLYRVSEANELAAALPNGATSDWYITVEAYVIEFATSVKDDNPRALDVSDEDQQNRIMVYTNVNPYADFVDGLGLGDAVRVRGQLQNYNGKYEIVNPVRTYKEYVALSFAYEFKATTDSICADYDGVTDNHDALLAVWGTLESKFNTLNDAQKARLVNPDSYGQGQLVKDMMERYDYLTGKYGLTNFIAGRTPTEFVNPYSEATINFNNNSNTMIIIISVIAAVSALSIGVLLVIKKRKHN